MKPIYSETKTDSLAACVASILEVELSEIPDFFSEEFSYNDPLQELKDFLESMGWLLISLPYTKDGALGIQIMELNHGNQYAIVWQDGTVLDPRPEGGPTGYPRAFFVLAPMDTTDYVRTVHSQPPDHACWSQVEPGTDFIVWDDLEDQILCQKFCFYADGRPWFADKPGGFEVQTYNYAAPAISVI